MYDLRTIAPALVHLNKGSRLSSMERVLLCSANRLPAQDESQTRSQDKEGYSTGLDVGGGREYKNLPSRPKQNFPLVYIVSTHPTLTRSTISVSGVSSPFVEIIQLPRWLPGTTSSASSPPPPALDRVSADPTPHGVIADSPFVTSRRIVDAAMAAAATTAAAPGDPLRHPTAIDLVPPIAIDTMSDTPHPLEAAHLTEILTTPLRLNRTVLDSVRDRNPHVPCRPFDGSVDHHLLTLVVTPLPRMHSTPTTLSQLLVIIMIRVTSRLGESIGRHLLTLGLSLLAPPEDCPAPPPPSTTSVTFHLHERVIVLAVTVTTPMMGVGAPLTHMVRSLPSMVSSHPLPLTYILLPGHTPARPSTAMSQTVPVESQLA
jgi:hypothetical protein